MSWTLLLQHRTLVLILILVMQIVTQLVPCSDIIRLCFFALLHLTGRGVRKCRAQPRGYCVSCNVYFCPLSGKTWELIWSNIHGQKTYKGSYLSLWPNHKPNSNQNIQQGRLPCTVLSVKCPRMTSKSSVMLNNYLLLSTRWRTFHSQALLFPLGYTWRSHRCRTQLEKVVPGKLLFFLAASIFLYIFSYIQHHVIVWVWVHGCCYLLACLYRMQQLPSLTCVSLS